MTEVLNKHLTRQHANLINQIALLKSRVERLEKHTHVPYREPIDQREMWEANRELTRKLREKDQELDDLRAMVMSNVRKREQAIKERDELKDLVN